MKLYARVNGVRASKHYPEMPVLQFALWDTDDEGVVSLMAEIDLPQATFLMDFTRLADDNSAYAQMLRAFVNSCATVAHAQTLVGLTFTSTDEAGDHE